MLLVFLSSGTFDDLMGQDGIHMMSHLQNSTIDYNLLQQIANGTFRYWYWEWEFLMLNGYF